jgi:fructose-1,6-bisphosphatase/inositol monophosphatase family enzyme
VDDLELAASLVRRAGDLAAAMLAEGLETSYKTSISDVVSAADHAAEDLVVSHLRQDRPEDGIIGEEGTNIPGAGTRTWFIDPVDGTYNFLSGLPIWSSAVALRDDSGPVLGAIYQPSEDELWVGGRDQTTTRNGVPLAPLEERPLSDISVSTYLHPAYLDDGSLRGTLLRAMEGAATVRMLGSGCVELAAIAAGRLGAWIHADTKPWDWWPGANLVVAAGGDAQVIGAHGHRWHIAGNKRAVGDLVDLVGS